jgi:hypothetical protein
MAPGRVALTGTAWPDDDPWCNMGSLSTELDSVDRGTRAHDLPPCKKSCVGPWRRSITPGVGALAGLTPSAVDRDAGSRSRYRRGRDRGTDWRFPSLIRGSVRGDLARSARYARSRTASPAPLVRSARGGPIPRRAACASSAHGSRAPSGDWVRALTTRSTRSRQRVLACAHLRQSVEEEPHLLGIVPGWILTSGRRVRRRYGRVNPWTSARRSGWSGSAPPRTRWTPWATRDGRRGAGLRPLRPRSSSSVAPLEQRRRLPVVEPTGLRRQRRTAGFSAGTGCTSAPRARSP